MFLKMQLIWVLNKIYIYIKIYFLLIIYTYLLYGSLKKLRYLKTEQQYYIPLYLHCLISLLNMFQFLNKCFWMGIFSFCVSERSFHFVKNDFEKCSYCNGLRSLSFELEFKFELELEENCLNESKRCEKIPA